MANRSNLVWQNTRQENNKGQKGERQSVREERRVKKRDKEKTEMCWLKNTIRKNTFLIRFKDVSLKQLETFINTITIPWQYTVY